MLITCIGGLEEFLRLGEMSVRFFRTRKRKMVQREGEMSGRFFRTRKMDRGLQQGCGKWSKEEWRRLIGILI